MQKAVSLKKTAKITLERLEDTDKSKYPSNTLKDYYDIIHELMESLTLKDGIKAKGEGAHMELIDYVCRTYKFTEQQRIFLQQLRNYRNRISYEGFSITEDFIVSNEKKIKNIVEKLFGL